MMTIKEQRKEKHNLLKVKPKKEGKNYGFKQEGSFSCLGDFDKFSDDEGEKKAKCKHCLKVFAADPIRNGTSALNRHITSCEKHPEKNDLGTNDVPTTTDWHYARRFAKSLEKFKHITIRASSSTNVVVNLFFKDIMEIDNHLRDLKGGSDLVNKVTGSKMQQKFEKYWHHDSDMNKLLYFAAILDPRQKFRVLKFGYTMICTSEKKEKNKEDDIDKMVDVILKNISDAFELLFKEYKLMYDSEISNKTCENEENVQVFSEGDGDFFAKFQSSGGFSSYNDKSELQKYLEDKEEGWYPSFDILQWWKSSSSRYPILSKMAKAPYLNNQKGKIMHSGVTNRSGAIRRRRWMVGEELIGLKRAGD
ncbi:hypothetical protein E3N88_28617 [Mikania micrantha]|uniref:BED-type domain-containing protein n=1 Tax=Mikania micrantha TaxID=192012 RepID=A0A5N6N0Z2_9ASTR|nr:hypothetical protein E3N88_28617 [Mikania micrantha]